MGEWIKGTDWIRRGWGHVVNGALIGGGHAASFVGATDVGDALKMAGGNEKAWAENNKAPAKGTTIQQLQAEGQKQQMAFANAEAVILAAPDVATLPMGIVKSFVIDTALEGAMHASAEQAPPRSIWSLILPSALGGDERYKKGATPLDYFDEKWDSPAETLARAEATASTIRINPTTNNSPTNDNELGFFGKLWAAIKFVANLVANLFKNPDTHSQTNAAVNQMSQSTSTKMTQLAPSQGIPTLIPNTQRGK